MPPRPHLVAAASILASIGAAAHAQTVQFRIVERTGQTIFTPTDPVLDLAVQGRIVGGPADACIAGFAFDMVMPGEPDAGGTLTRGLINNLDHTYATTIAVNNTVGRGGVAYSYSYLAGISASFNGVINVSSGTFTNTPASQEIGNITGVASGASLIGTPGIDVANGDALGSIPPASACTDTNPRADCNPDTWNASHPWNSSLGPAPVPAAGDTAPVDPAVGPTYFGQGGQWIDLYRFRYTLTDLTVRPITFTLARPVASIGHQFVFSNGSWALQGAPATVSVQPLGLNAGASGACCNGSSCLITGAPACAAISGQFNPAQTCVTGSPNNYVVCCYANFDRINGLDAPDIFAWINAWFAGDPRADADHDGVLRLIDIFTFLNAWFAGCS